MMFQIEFVAGSLQGERFAIGDQPLTLGRSRSNSIRLAEADVSGEHLRLSLSGQDGVAVENLSRRQGRTSVNGSVLDIGASVVLHEGDEVGVGGVVVFRIAVHRGVAPNDMPTIVGSSEPRDNVTRPPAGTSSASIEVTMVQRTIDASDEELERIKNDIRAGQRKRMLVWIVPLVLALVALVSLYVALRPVPEEFTSWPSGADGEYLRDYFLAAPYLAIAYPAIDGATVSTNEPGRAEINTALGRLHDIPLRIIVRTSSDPDSLETDHCDALDKVLRSISEKDTTFSPGVNRVHRFIGTTTSAGVPVSYLNYTRRKGADEFFGYLVFLRQAAESFTVLLEVPLSARWRAEDFLRSSIGHFVIYARRRIAEHWEGCSWYRRGTSIASDAEEAKKFLNQKAPVHWEAAFMRIESVLVKAAKAGRRHEQEEAVRLLVVLREAQTVWYNQQKLSYLEAKVAGQRETMQSIQSLCESAFTPLFQDFDFRYDMIKRKDWR